MNVANIIYVALLPLLSAFSRVVKGCLNERNYQNQQLPPLVTKEPEGIAGDLDRK